MNQTSKSVLNNNNARRMQGWASGLYPANWRDRCIVVTEYLNQLDDDTATDLIKKGWPEVFSAAERDWPEAFAVWTHDVVENR